MPAIRGRCRCDPPRRRPLPACRPPTAGGAADPHRGLEPPLAPAPATDARPLRAAPARALHLRVCLGQAGDGERGAALRADHRLAGTHRRAARGTAQRILARCRSVERRRLDGVERIERMREPGDVEQARHRVAPGALRVVLADVAAAVDAFDAASLAQKPRAIGQRHRSQQPLFLQELRERLVGAVRAARTAAASSGPSATGCGRGSARRHSAGSAHRRAAARAAARASSHRADQVEQAPAAAQLRRLDGVEPDYVAAAAQVELDRARVVTGERQALHRAAAVAAGQQRLRAARPARSRAVRHRRRRHAPAGRRGSSSARSLRPRRA